MKPNILVSPGLPRSGTTYTFHSLISGKNRDNFNAPKTKEINFFSRDRDIKDFFGFFDSADENKIYIDYSPSYLVGRSGAIKRIVENKDYANFKFILHLRHPVDQMYAHYLHDIKAHISKRHYGDDVKYSFFSEKALKKYAAYRSNAVKEIIEKFGRENVLPVNFYSDIGKPKQLSDKISKFLGCALSNFNEQKVSPGGWLPYYVYGGNNGVEVAHGENVVLVPERCLLLVNGHDSKIWRDVEESLAGKLIEASSSWTREVTREQYSSLFSALEEDWLSVLKLLGEDRENYEVKENVKAGPAHLSNEVINELIAPGVRVSDTLGKCAYNAG